MAWRIAIPSYQREQVLKDKTLALLERHDIPSSRIDIFVANPEEAERYMGLFPSYNIIVGCLGISNIRNFITDYYILNQPVVQMDDDIDEVYELTDNNLEPTEDLGAIINRAFALCISHKKNLWGVYPIKNKFFMKDDYSTGLSFCIGHFFGYFNQKIPVSLVYKEDIERSLLYAVKDTGVIRLRNVCCKTSMGRRGGIGVKIKDRVEPSMLEIDKLISIFGPLVRHNPKRRGDCLLKSSIMWK
jgi:hypothetical protein